MKERLFPIISYSCGVLLGFLPIAAYFFSHGALDDAIWNSYIQCRYQLATWGLAFPSLSKTLTLLSSEGWSAFIFSEGFRWYLPICIFLIVAGYLTYRGLSGIHSTNTMKLLLLLLGGVAFFRTALGRSDGGHLNFGATFLWLLCLLPLEGGILNVFRVGLSSLKGKTPWHAALKATWVLIPTIIFCWYVGEVHHPLTGFNQKWQRLRQNPFKQNVVPGGINTRRRGRHPRRPSATDPKSGRLYPSKYRTERKDFRLHESGCLLFFRGSTRCHAIPSGFVCINTFNAGRGDCGT